MADLVNRIQAAILGSANAETVRELLRELQIPAGQPRQPDAFSRFRRAMLYSGASEAELRSALGDLGLSGGGGGGEQALRDIRAGLLRNL